jgi:hypothetical protein
MMNATIGRRGILRLSTQIRQFSSTSTRHAAEVKKLGVIGAGQMVSVSCVADM